jgi:hypothetical protein
LIKNGEATVEEIENPYKKYKKIEFSQLPDEVLQLVYFLLKHISNYFDFILPIIGKQEVIYYNIFSMIILMQKVWKDFKR